MEIREGYKKTEVGVIPQEWKVFYLNEACERISVGLATSVTKYYRESGVPIIRNLNIKDGYFDSRDMLFLEPEFAKQNLTKAANAYDVLTVHTGSNLGLTCVLPPEFKNSQTFTTLITTPQKNKLDSFFLCYHMSSSMGKAEMQRLQVGGGKGNLNTGDLKKYCFAIPPTIAEQQAIATALSDMDGLISSLTKLIDKKKNIKQGAMQMLLSGKKRLDGFSGEINYVSLKSTCSAFCDGDWIESKDQSDNGYRLIQTGNVGIGKYLDKSEKKRYISEDTFTRLKCTEIYKEDVLVSRLPEPAGRACIVPESKEPMITAVDCTIIRFGQNYNAVLFVNYTQTPEYQKQIDMMLGGSTRQRISRKELGQVVVPVFPSEEEQTAIANILSDMDNEIETLEQKQNKYIAIKQGMMQELLTGRIRLVEEVMQ